MKAVTHDTSARCLLCSVATCDAAAMTIATAIEIGNQDVGCRFRVARFVAIITATDFSPMRRVREIRVRQEQLREFDGRYRPMGAAIVCLFRYDVTIRARSAFKQILGNLERLDAGFCRRAVTIGT